MGILNKLYPKLNVEPKFSSSNSSLFKQNNDFFLKKSKKIYKKHSAQQTSRQSSELNAYQNWLFLLHFIY